MVPKLRFWHRAVVAALTILGFNRFGYLQRIIDFNAQVTNCAIQRIVETKLCLPCMKMPDVKTFVKLCSGVKASRVKRLGQISVSICHCRFSN